MKKSSLVLAAIVSALSLAAPATAHAAAHAATVKDRVGDVTGMNGAAPSNTPGFKALVPSIDITKVKVKAEGRQVSITVTVRDLPDPSAGKGPIVSVWAHHDGDETFSATGSYYTSSNMLSDAGVQSECGATGTFDMAKNRVTLTFPEQCFAGATKVSSIDVDTIGYDGKTLDLPQDEAVVKKKLRLKAAA